ncbi:MAG TPA: SUF system NifU family Fe-S cluster assembly protein [Candidatus Saccharimonadales bacterium]|nr:SUF system NifU family Fe-S cluster assembly protein [Candidatus Saccharimonadales bacterium]
MEDLYREHILDHYKNPRNRGTLEHPDATFEDSNPLCGDQLRMDFRIRDGVLEDVKFSGGGCSISQAAASMLTERVKGRSLEEIKKITREDVLEDLGIALGPVRLKCALLALKVLKGGVYGVHEWPGDDGAAEGESNHGH